MASRVVETNKTNCHQCQADKLDATPAARMSKKRKLLPLQGRTGSAQQTRKKTLLKHSHFSTSFPTNSSENSLHVVLGQHLPSFCLPVEWVGLFLNGHEDSDSDSDPMRARCSSHGSRSMLKRPNPLEKYVLIMGEHWQKLPTKRTGCECSRDRVPEGTTKKTEAGKHLRGATSPKPLHSAA